MKNITPIPLDDSLDDSIVNSKKKNENNLTYRQQIFADEYLRNGKDIIKALKVAGFCKGSKNDYNLRQYGYNLLKSDYMKAYIQKQTSLYWKDKQADIEEVIAIECEMARGGIDSHGEPIPKAVQQRAIETLLKMSGRLDERNNVTVNAVIPLIVDDYH